MAAYAFHAVVARHIYLEEGWLRCHSLVEEMFASHLRHEGLTRSADAGIQIDFYEITEQEAQLQNAIAGEPLYRAGDYRVRAETEVDQDEPA